MFLMITILVILCLAAFLFYWGRRIPVAWAWYPQTHEKITCFAMDLLKAQQRPTLLAWVLRQAGLKMGVWVNALQMRRGSIEEDMNSSVFIEVPEPTDLTTRPVDRSGANGGYHFYNPVSKKGTQRSELGITRGCKPHSFRCSHAPCHRPGYITSDTRT